MAAVTSAGPVRLAWLGSSPQRFVARLQATWLASSAGASRWIMPRSIWPFLAAAFGQDAGGRSDEGLHTGHANQIGWIRTSSQGAVLGPFFTQDRLGIQAERRAACLTDC